MTHLETIKSIVWRPMAANGVSCPQRWSKPEGLYTALLRWASDPGIPQRRKPPTMHSHCSTEVLLLCRPVPCHVLRKLGITPLPRPLTFRNAQDAFLFTSLYSSGAPAPFYRPRTRHSRPAPSKAATPHFAAYRYPHLERRRCVERGRTSLSAGLQYLSDVFLQSAAVGC